MPAGQDEGRKDAFNYQREAAFSHVISLVDGRIASATPSVVLHLQEKSPDLLRANAAIEAWSLFLNGIQHLKSGAPEGGPGSMPEALSRTSLRASPLAAALGISRPQFEPMYFAIDYTTGTEAALFLFLFLFLFLCHRLIDGAEADFPKSRHLIQQKILAEKPSMNALKEQMALSFDVLAGTYEQVCGEIREELVKLYP